jgi:hypothetical protein
LFRPHAHANDVWVKVEEGEIGVLVGEEIRTAVEGDRALKPRAVRHAMWNPTPRPARATEVLTPAGSERWFEELARLADDDNAGFAEPCERYGIRFLLTSRWWPVSRRTSNSTSRSIASSRRRVRRESA